MYMVMSHLCIYVKYYMYIRSKKKSIKVKEASKKRNRMHLTQGTTTLPNRDIAKVSYQVFYLKLGFHLPKHTYARIPIQFCFTL